MRLTEEASQCSRQCREGRGGGKDWSKVAGQGWDGQEISVERQLQPPGPLISHGLLLQPWLGETCDRGLSGLLSSETLQEPFVSRALAARGGGVCSTASQTSG